MKPIPLVPTPLMIAVVSRKMEMVQFLLSQKADPKITSIRWVYLNARGRFLWKYRIW